MDDFKNRNKLWQSDKLGKEVASARVVIGGMGGLGWLIGSSLVGLGVTTIDIFDPDPLEAVNLNRLWGCRRQQIGEPKVEIFSKLARDINPSIEISANAEAIPSMAFEKAVAKADVVFGGYDRPEPRLATQIFSKIYNTLYIDTGVAIQTTDSGFSGFGQVFVSGENNLACIVCCGLKLDSIGYRGEGGAPEPSSGIPNAILANLAVTQWIQSLQKNELSSMTLFNWTQNKIDQIDAEKPVVGCPICGDDPAWKNQPYS